MPTGFRANMLPHSAELLVAKVVAGWLTGWLTDNKHPERLRQRAMVISSFSLFAVPYSPGLNLDGTSSAQQKQRYGLGVMRSSFSVHATPTTTHPTGGDMMCPTLSRQQRTRMGVSWLNSFPTLQCTRVCPLCVHACDVCDPSMHCRVACSDRRQTYRGMGVKDFESQH